MKEKLKEIVRLRNPAQVFFSNVVSFLKENYDEEHPNFIFYKIGDITVFYIDYEKNILYVDYDNMWYYLEEYYDMNLIQTKTFISDNIKYYLNWDFNINNIKCVEGAKL